MAESARFLLGLDAGNTVIKAVLFDLRRAASSRRASDGQSHDARARPCRARPRGALAKRRRGDPRLHLGRPASTRAQIAAIGCAGHGNGLYLLDRDGGPLLGIQSLDTRAAALAEELPPSNGDAPARDLPAGALAVADADASRLGAPAPPETLRRGRHAAHLQGLRHLPADRAPGQRHLRHGGLPVCCACPSAATTTTCSSATACEACDHLLPSLIDPTEIAGR